MENKLSLDFETNKKAESTNTAFNHLRDQPNGYKFRGIRYHQLIVVWNSITCAGSTEFFSKKKFSKTIKINIFFKSETQKSYLQQVVHLPYFFRDQILNYQKQKNTKKISCILFKWKLKKLHRDFHRLNQKKTAINFFEFFSHQNTKNICE